MGIVYNSANIVSDGLILHLDTVNPKSYQGSGSTILDISRNGVTATMANFSTTDVYQPGVRILPTSGRINLPTLTNITTVELWFYQHSTSNNVGRYLLDARTGGTGGWIYSGGNGANWQTGKMYINGVYVGSPVWATMESQTLQKNSQVVVVANTPITDDMNLFSRYSNSETLDVTFYNAKVYNRELSAIEIQQNFEALRKRFNI